MMLLREPVALLTRVHSAVCNVGIMHSFQITGYMRHCDASYHRHVHSVASCTHFAFFPHGDDGADTGAVSRPNGVPPRS